MPYLSYLPLSRKYAQPLLDLWNDWAVVRYTNRSLPCTPAQVLEGIDLLSRFDVFAILEKEDFIGLVGCPGIEGEESRFGFFYQLKKEVWGRSCGKTAASWMVAYMTEHHPASSLYADVAAQNTSSERILTRLGFQLQAEKEQLLHGSPTVIRSYWRYIPSL